MVRIYVLGGGGSGKTTLAAALARRLGCPAVHLDDALECVIRTMRCRAFSWLGEK
jgi:adenylate kinase family enzyme